MQTVSISIAEIITYIMVTLAITGIGAIGWEAYINLKKKSRRTISCPLMEKQCNSTIINKPSDYINDKNK